jgi:lipopolysaccharide heptosyltransferase I
MSSPRILIVKTSSMGDIVHALPLVSDLAAHVPGARIEWVLEEGFAPIARLHPAVERVHTVALRRWRKQPFAADTWSELHAARAELRAQRYDRIIDCQGLAKSAWVAHWARAPGWTARRRASRWPHFSTTRRSACRAASTRSRAIARWARRRLATRPMRSRGSRCAFPTCRPG